MKELVHQVFLDVYQSCFLSCPFHLACSVECIFSSVLVSTSSSRVYFRLSLVTKSAFFKLLCCLANCGIQKDSRYLERRIDPSRSSVILTNSLRSSTKNRCPLLLSSIFHPVPVLFCSKELNRAQGKRGEETEGLLGRCHGWCHGRVGDCPLGGTKRNAPETYIKSFMGCVVKGLVVI